MIAIDPNSAEFANVLLTSHPKELGYLALQSETGAKLLRRAVSPNSQTAEASDTAEQSIDLTLFDNAAALKVAMSQMAMHLSNEWRDTLRKQIDSLLSLEHWEEDSSTANLESFKSFLRFVIHARPRDLPGLGVGPGGNVLAAWHHAENQVSVEFDKDSSARAIVIRSVAREGDAPDLEYISWRGRVANLRDFVERNGVADCLG